MNIFDQYLDKIKKIILDLTIVYLSNIKNSKYVSLVSQNNGL